MSGFQVPFSSSPPSTPDRRSQDDSKQSLFRASNPSTTPAGPPPSSAGSFTPAGPPPSSVFGSSRLGPPQNNQPFSSLQFSNTAVLNAPTFQLNNPESSPSNAPFERAPAAGQRSGLSNEYLAPQGDNFSPDLSDDQNDDEDMNEDSENYDQHNPSRGLYNDNSDQMDEDLYGDDYYGDDQDIHDLQFDDSLPLPRPESRNDDVSPQPDFLNSSLLRQSRQSDLITFQKSNKTQPLKDFLFNRVAQDMGKQMGIPRVNEADDLVLETEQLIMKFYKDGLEPSNNDDALSRALTTTSSELLRTWEEYNSRTLTHVSEEYATAIGPGPRASKFAHANFLASLLLRLHHPAPVEPPPVPVQSLRGSLLRGSVAPIYEGKRKAVPLLLLEWMDDYHDPYPDQLNEIQAHRPSPANHPLFWDTLLNSLLRGRLVAVISALKHAGWKHARAALEDSHEDTDHEGYSGVALRNIEIVIDEALQVLQQCPAVKGDWDIRDSDWTLFRLRTSQALENLKRFVEGRNQDTLERGKFGLSSVASGPKSYTGIAKKAESQVPWNIYQNLLTLYALVLGDEDAIIESSQDWCEATVGLVVWWNPGKDDRRLALTRSQFSTNESDVDVYLQKLANSFYAATAESTDFQVNTLDPVELGLASAFEGDTAAAVCILRSYSGPVSSAVAEIAYLGGWLPRVESQNLITMDSLDQDDMDVLGISGPSAQSEDVKDHTLIVYAESLTKRGQMEMVFERSKIVRDGWELAIEIFGRLNSATKQEEEVARMLSDFSLESSAVVDKLWRLLSDLGMTGHAESVAETYADGLAEQSYKYGEALWYYALAHKPKKVKDVLDLVISLSLIHSVAYPPEAELDDHLRRLISTPKAALTELSKMDPEAAGLVHKMLSGYATLRRFYDLRDAEVMISPGKKPEMGAIARRREAVAAIIAVIMSADDNIRGGLYDEERGAVVSADFLLALLGEAMAFVNQPKMAVTLSQIDALLKTVEDLQTVPPRIYAACNEFFQTVVASTQGMKGSTPMDLLKKSTSSLSGTSSYSLVGSSILASQLQRSIGSSGVLVKGNVKRGWDWRRGISAGTTSKQMIQILRFGLAQDLARAWVREADGF